MHVQISLQIVPWLFTLDHIDCEKEQIATIQHSSWGAQIKEQIAICIAEDQLYPAWLYIASQARQDTHDTIFEHENQPSI